MADAQAHILYVEDSEDDRKLYTYFLSKKGFRVSTATNGREALQKALELQPDLILMDLGFPKSEAGRPRRS